MESNIRDSDLKVPCFLIHDTAVELSVSIINSLSFIRGRKCLRARCIAFSSSQLIDISRQPLDHTPDTECGRITPPHPVLLASVMSWMEGVGIDIGIFILR